VAFESPQRLPGTLRSLAAAQPERPVAVCRELTKRFEEVARGSATELAERFAEPPKGEIALVLGPFVPSNNLLQSESEAAAAVAELVAAGVGRNQAARLVARLTGVPKSSLYRTSL
jgi:16S rRNA (cytidine1402-2'-O)-methyltransferase